MNGFSPKMENKNEEEEKILAKNVLKKVNQNQVHG